jgi:hypothetical protein
MELEHEAESSAGAQRGQGRPLVEAGGVVAGHRRSGTGGRPIEQADGG